jgi:hypothetical protein
MTPYISKKRVELIRNISGKRAKKSFSNKMEKFIFIIQILFLCKKFCVVEDFLFPLHKDWIGCGFSLRGPKRSFAPARIGANAPNLRKFRAPIQSLCGETLSVSPP